MEKHITRWTYWLGSASLAIALAWGALNVGLGSLPAPVLTRRRRTMSSARLLPTALF